MEWYEIASQSSSDTAEEPKLVEVRATVDVAHLRHPRPGQDPGLFRGEVQLFVGPDDCWHDSTETEELDSMAGHTYQPGLSFDDVLSFLRCDFCRVSPRDIVWAYGEP